MEAFFDVTDLATVIAQAEHFNPIDTESVPLQDAVGRVLAEDVIADVDLPGFSRATMDGYAVSAASTFGAGEGSPAYLTVVGEVEMGQPPGVSVGAGQAAWIPTGAMLPPGADAVVMIEHTEALDDTTIEAYRSVAPGQHVIEKDEDFARNETILKTGSLLRSQEAGLLAAFGHTAVPVFRKPVVGIISTGDEIVPIDSVPAAGQIRDINSTTLSGQVADAGGVPVTYGIVADDYEVLRAVCAQAVAASDMVLVSGGSSVGVRDYTIDALGALPGAEILVHGISIRPGKPTILARVGGKSFWGLPGHVVSAMIVFSAVVRPFLHRIGGRRIWSASSVGLRARISRNLFSAQGRVDFVRVQVRKTDDGVWADPLLGKSGLINTMVRADGLVAIGMNDEGLEAGTEVEVLPF